MSTMRGMFVDTLKNLLTRLGTSYDKTSHTQYAFFPIDKAQLENGFRSDWILRKVITIPAADATREWREWQQDGESIEEIEELEKQHRIQQKVYQARVKSRLYGGAALVLGVDGAGTQDQPLDLERVRSDSLKFVHVVSKYDLKAGPLVQDLMSPDYGKPEFYERTVPQLIRIHPSRVVRFEGAEVPDPQLSNDGWGDSVVQVLDDACKAAGLVSASGATLVQELCYDIIKIPGFMEQVATKEYEDRLTARFAYSSSAKSVIRATLIDKEEDWERVTTNITALPDVLKVYLLLASGAADIPATRMLSQSPTGMSATGESDTRNYYDRIKSEQITEQEPALNTLDEVLIRSALGEKPDGTWYTWRPLWQLNDKEKAERDKAKADAFKIDVDTALINPDVLRTVRINQLVEDDVYPGLEDAIEKFGDEPEEPEGQFDPVTGLPTDPVLQAAGKIANENADPNVAAAKGRPPPQAVADWQSMRVRADAILVNDARLRFADRDRRGRYRRKYQFARDATPRTLYLRRDLLNGDELLAHFREQGVGGLVAASELHTTVAYSKTPIDWMKIGGETWRQNEDGTLTVPPGGIRLVEALGPEGVTVLMFTSEALSWRHESICHAGASWDYEAYQPHITFAEPMSKDQMRALEPFRGELRFGIEVAEEIDPNWQASMQAAE